MSPTEDHRSHPKTRTLSEVRLWLHRAGVSRLISATVACAGAHGRAAVWPGRVHRHGLGVRPDRPSALTAAYALMARAKWFCFRRWLRVSPPTVRPRRGRRGRRRQRLTITFRPGDAATVAINCLAARRTKSGETYTAGGTLTLPRTVGDYLPPLGAPRHHRADLFRRLDGVSLYDRLRGELPIVYFLMASGCLHVAASPSPTCSPLRPARRPSHSRGLKVDPGHRPSIWWRRWSARRTGDRSPSRGALFGGGGSGRRWMVFLLPPAACSPPPSADRQGAVAPGGARCADGPRLCRYVRPGTTRRSAIMPRARRSWCRVASITRDPISGSSLGLALMFGWHRWPAAHPDALLSR